MITNNYNAIVGLGLIHCGIKNAKNNCTVLDMRYSMASFITLFAIIHAALRMTPIYDNDLFIFVPTSPPLRPLSNQISITRLTP